MGLELCGDWKAGGGFTNQPENSWPKGSGKTYMYSFSDGI